MRRDACLDRRELRGGGVDRAPQRRVVEARRQVPHDEAEERVSRGRARRARSNRWPTGLGVNGARVNRARVVVGARVGLDAAAQPLGRAAQAVEVGVADDGVRRPDARDDLGRDHLGAGPVLGLGGENEARVVAVARVHDVVVVVDPAREPMARAAR